MPATNGSAEPCTLARHVLRGGAGPALTWRGGAWSHDELAERVARLAGWMAARAAPGARVAIWAAKSPAAVAAMLAAGEAGLVAVPVHPGLRGRQAQHVAGDSGAALLLADASRRGQLSGALDLDAVVAEAARHAPAPALPGGDRLAMLFYTSGSTGMPKGVMVSHANLVAGVDSVRAYLPTDADARVAALLPLAFDFGWSQVTTALAGGGTAVLDDMLGAGDVVRVVEAGGCTHFAGVPPMLLPLARPGPPLLGLAQVSTSGGRLPEAAVHALLDRLPGARLHLMYGLTEAFRATHLPPERARAMPWSIGRAIPGAEVLVMAGGQPAKAHEEGELVQAGAHVALGYWRRPEETAARFRPAPAASRLGGRAAWSGDRGVADAQGWLRFVGRADHMFKVSGHRVSPTEVEELAHASGAVAEAALIATQDEALGQRLCLHAVPAPGATATDAEDRLRAFLLREAPAHLRPAAIRWHRALPHTANGKPDRQALAAL